MLREETEILNFAFQKFGIGILYFSSVERCFEIENVNEDIRVNINYIIEA